MLEVVTVLYWLELAFCYLIGSLIAITAWTLWMLDGKSRLLEQIQGVLPLRNRWLRYFVGALLFPLILALPAASCALLLQIPALPGSIVLTTLFSGYLWKVFAAEARRSTG